MYSDEDGIKAVQLARHVVDSVVKGTPIGKIAYPRGFDEKAGVFTTINRYPSGELRGCIGFPEPTFKIVEAIVSSGRSAALRDPRFNPVTPGELDSIVVEVSLLTPPEKVVVDSPEEYLDKIVVGKHGLIMKRSLASGLLLPQVPVEWNWNVEEFLDHTCVKAGMEKGCWRRNSTEVFVFEGEVFMEKTPRGEVVRKPFHSCERV